MFIHWIIIIGGTVGIATVAVAIEEEISVEKIYDMAENIINSTNRWQNELKENNDVGRKSKFFPFLFPFHALWGFGSLHALGILFAIKFKIIVVVIIVALSIFYYKKVLIANKCNGETSPLGSIFPAFDNSQSSSNFLFSGLPTGYSNHMSHEIGGYNGPDPYSAYHDIHPDLSSVHFDHSGHHSDYSNFYHNHDHEHHDHEHHDHEHHDHEHHDHEHHDHDHEFLSSDPTLTSPPVTSSTYRRVGKQRRKRSGAKPEIEFFSFGELAFQFLGVDTEGCRRRFVCELDFRARTNPVTRLAFSFIGRNFFERYRVLEEDTAPPQKFSDCAKVYNNCKAAEKYDSIDEISEDENESDFPLDKNEENIDNGDKLDSEKVEGDLSAGTKVDTESGEDVTHKRSDKLAYFILERNQ